MNKTTFSRFKQDLVNSGFTGDVMYMGYLWLSLTNKQVQEVRELAMKHAKIIGYRPDESIRVGMFIFF